MREELTELICCPACGGRLQIHAAAESSVEVWDGTLECPACDVAFPIQNGMPLLYVNDARWASKAREAEGWVAYHKKLGIYDLADEDRIDIHIPYYPEEPWIGVAQSFDVALKALNLTGEESVLDLGAGRGWAAKQFALRGCRVVALDIVPDEHVGLGRGQALMNHAGVYFDRLIGDAERLPFFDNSFDLVFCSATLHHTSDLPLLCQNIARVLKPGGRLCAIREPCISVGENEQAVLVRDAMDELEVGINENRPNLLDYIQALDVARLEPIRAAPVNALPLNEVDLRSWAFELGITRPPIWLNRPRETVGRWRHYGRPRWEAMKQGNFWRTQRLLRRFHGRQQIEMGILLWVSGELLLIAGKRSER